MTALDYVRWSMIIGNGAAAAVNFVVAFGGSSITSFLIGAGNAFMVGTFAMWMPD